jgi:hypothetical protein
MNRTSVVIAESSCSLRGSRASFAVRVRRASVHRVALVRTGGASVSRVASARVASVARSLHALRSASAVAVKVQSCAAAGGSAEPGLG